MGVAGEIGPDGLAPAKGRLLQTTHLVLRSGASELSVAAEELQLAGRMCGGTTGERESEVGGDRFVRAPC
jgi:hypothetical protein